MKLNRKSQAILPILILALTIVALILIFFAAASFESKTTEIGYDYHLMLQSYDDAEMAREYMALSAKYSAYAAFDEVGCPSTNIDDFDTIFFSTFESYLNNYTNNKPELNIDIFAASSFSDFKNEITLSHNDYGVAITSTSLKRIQAEGSNFKSDISSRFVTRADCNDYELIKKTCRQINDAVLGTTSSCL